ncbi:PhzF family phenazine biosynthesis protein [Sphingomonas lutea]|uniref:PhzF family phenazine biosynthesis protein n=1 Tax=Sphingomonas lutea TaxID=1045317 RepID=A0A7G9SHN8_9SPHN|nr:PhzF family phenazine biosynthesis protein [Sphingomonas lutea]QNN67363.1 PhzF family phenazine biosynthesis protein [Sphingomonas lutea]
MTSLPFFQVDAFVEGPLSGNPAAVMPLDRWLDDDLMQAVAAENNLSETAFTVASEADDADYELRWFTPEREVGMCGHATMASGHILITGKQVRFATRKAGVLTVRRAGEGLELDLPAWHPQPARDDAVLEALGVSGETFRADGAEAVLIVMLDSEEAVRAVAPAYAALRKIDALVIVTAPGDEQDIASRVFAANVGIDEDPVTGAAHAALVPFWAERLGRKRFTALQASKRRGLLDCRLEGDRVVLGGRCHTVIVGQFQL